MNAQLVAILAAIAAAQARVAAMQSANAASIANGNGLVHEPNEFFHEARHLDMLSIEARNA